GDDVGDRGDADGDAGGLGGAAVRDRVGERRRGSEVGAAVEGPRIAVAERLRAVAGGKGRVADRDRGAVDGGDLGAALEIVGAGILVRAAHRIECAGFPYATLFRSGDDVGDRGDADGDAGGLGGAAVRDRVGERRR